MGKTETQQDEAPQTTTVRAEPWRPPVDLSHLNLQQQWMVEEILCEKSAAFA